MKLDVLEIKNTNSFLIKKGSLGRNRKYILNGEVLTDLRKSIDITISELDSFHYDPDNNITTHYSNGSNEISIEYFKSKPQYYDDESSDEYTLRAIANKNELKDYKPIQKKAELELIEFNICGILENTKSSFIGCSIPSQYSEAIVYHFNVLNCAMDEYNILRKKYSTHADFGVPEKNRSYLRFVKINNQYAFSDIYPFSDYSKPKSYTNLKQARCEESNVRELVRKAVYPYINKDVSEFKKIQILNNLKLIKNLKTKSSIVDMINLLINDLEECVNIK